MNAHKQYADNMVAMTKQIKLIAKGRVKPKMQSAGGLTIEELREVQRAACALAAAAQAECNYYTDLIVELEPPG